MQLRTKITYEEAKQCVTEHKAVARTLISNYDDDQHWIFLFKQLADPENVRPIKELEPGADRTWVRDFTTNEWQERKLENLPRGRAKPGKKQIKAVSGTLLPPDGRMRLYNHANINKAHDHTIIVFDIEDEECKIKALFLQDAGTNTKFWIKGQPLNNYHKGIYPNAVSLERLREQNVNFMQNLAHKTRHKDERNEVLIKPSKKSVRCFAASKDTLYDRLSALHKKLMFMQWIKIDGQPIDVPVLIICPTHGIKEYTEDNIIADIKTAEMGQDIKAKFAARECVSLIIFFQTELPGLFQLLNNHFGVLAQQSSQSVPTIFKNYINYSFSGNGINIRELTNMPGTLYSLYLLSTQKIDTDKTFLEFCEEYKLNSTKPIIQTKPGIALQARFIWTDVVSNMEEVNKTYLTNHLTLESDVIDRIKTLGITKDLQKIYQDCIQYLKVHSAIVFTFDAQFLAQGLENYYPLNVFERNNKGTQYQSGRITTENGLFKDINPALLDLLKKNVSARPRYAALMLLDKDDSIASYASYGKSYVVFHDVVKFNSLFLPENAMTLKLNYQKDLQPCTYHHFEILLHQAPAALLRNLVAAVAPQANISPASASHIEVLIPALNLLDPNIVQHIHIHKQDYELKPGELYILKEKGLSISNSIEDLYKDLSKELCGYIEKNNHLRINELLSKYPLLVRHPLNSNLEKPIHVAAKLGNMELFNLLLKRGAKPNELTKTGESALSLALIEGKHDFIFTTIANRAVTEVSHKSDCNWLYLGICKALKESDKATLDYLIQLITKDKDFVKMFLETKITSYAMQEQEVKDLVPAFSPYTLAQATQLKAGDSVCIKDSPTFTAIVQEVQDSPPRLSYVEDNTTLVKWMNLDTPEIQDLIHSHEKVYTYTKLIPKAEDLGICQEILLKLLAHSYPALIGKFIDAQLWDKERLFQLYNTAIRKKMTAIVPEIVKHTQLLDETQLSLLLAYLIFYEYYPEANIFLEHQPQTKIKGYHETKDQLINMVISKGPVDYALIDTLSKKQPIMQPNTAGEITLTIAAKKPHYVELLTILLSNMKSTAQQLAYTLYTLSNHQKHLDTRIVQEICKQGADLSVILPYQGSELPLLLILFKQKRFEAINEYLNLNNAGSANLNATFLSEKLLEAIQNREIADVKAILAIMKKCNCIDLFKPQEIYTETALKVQSYTICFDLIAAGFVASGLKKSLENLLFFVATSGDVAKVKTVIEHRKQYDFDINAKDDYGNAVLHYAAIKNKELFFYLVSQGADLLSLDNNGNSAFSSYLKHQIKNANNKTDQLLIVWDEFRSLFSSQFSSDQQENLARIFAAELNHIGIKYATNELHKPTVSYQFNAVAPTIVKAINDSDWNAALILLMRSALDSEIFDTNILLDNVLLTQELHHERLRSENSPIIVKDVKVAFANCLAGNHEKLDNLKDMLLISMNLSTFSAFEVTTFVFRALSSIKNYREYAEQRVHQLQELSQQHELSEQDKYPLIEQVPILISSLCLAALLENQPVAKQQDLTEVRKAIANTLKAACVALAKPKPKLSMDKFEQAYQLYDKKKYHLCGITLFQSKQSQQAIMEIQEAENDERRYAIANAYIQNNHDKGFAQVLRNTMLIPSKKEELTANQLTRAIQSYETYKGRFFRHLAPISRESLDVKNRLLAAKTNQERYAIAHDYILENTDKAFARALQSIKRFM